MKLVIRSFSSLFSATNSFITEAINKYPIYSWLLVVTFQSHSASFFDGLQASSYAEIPLLSKVLKGNPFKEFTVSSLSKDSKDSHT
tara:strand:- start:451 stop:708 length:258 start_codon:yes stop_codon:yes gene_type:complete